MGSELVLAKAELARVAAREGWVGAGGSSETAAAARRGGGGAAWRRRRQIMEQTRRAMAEQGEAFRLEAEEAEARLGRAKAELQAAQ